jgi:hypothetical protein
MTGIVKSFDSLSGKGLITLQMVEKTFFFTFQPLTPENQNYSFQDTHRILSDQRSLWSGGCKHLSFLKQRHLPVVSHYWRNDMGGKIK